MSEEGIWLMKDDNKDEIRTRNRKVIISKNSGYNGRFFKVLNPLPIDRSKVLLLHPSSFEEGKVRIGRRIFVKVSFKDGSVKKDYADKFDDDLVFYDCFENSRIKNVETIREEEKEILKEEYYQYLHIIENPYKGSEIVIRNRWGLFDIETKIDLEVEEEAEGGE